MITDCAGGTHTPGPGRWPLAAGRFRRLSTPIPGTPTSAPTPIPGTPTRAPHPHRARPAEAMIICFVIMGLLSFWPQ
jgi:hypothetical protein